MAYCVPQTTNSVEMENNSKELLTATYIDKCCLFWWLLISPISRCLHC